MKDYFDLWVLARQADFDGDTRNQAIRATFGRRMTPLPDVVPFGLTPDFAEDRQKQTQWRAFLAKTALETCVPDGVRDLLLRFLMPAMNAAKADVSLVGRWPPGGDWS